MKIGIAALLALGLNVVVGFAGLLDLGTSRSSPSAPTRPRWPSGAAKYSVALSAQQDVSRLHPEWHMYFWLFFFLAIGIAMGTGVLLGAPTLRLRGDYLAIVTLGFGEIVRITANNLDSLANGPRGVLEIPNPEIDFGSFHYGFGINNEPYYWLLLAIIVAWVFLLRRLNDSRVGRAWAAIREDELAAASMGVPTVRMKLWAFSIGAAVASLGGVHLRELGVVHQPGHVRAVQHLVRVGDDPGDGRARRHGRVRRAHRRRGDDHLPARAVPLGRRRPVPGRSAWC